jgi:chemotaxis protein MotB
MRRAKAKASTEFDELDSELNADGGNEWQMTYLDTVTILLAFFIILASMADTDIRTIMGTGSPEIVDAPEFQKATSVLFYPIEALQADLEQSMAEELASGVLRLDKGTYEIRMKFSGSSLYASGSADLLPEGRAMIARVVARLSKLERQDFQLDVEGHTDSAPIRTVKFLDNWQLSAARAAGIVRSFLDAGVPATKLKASGYADTFPEVKEKDARGNYIAANQNLNRRIVIRLYYN